MNSDSANALVNFDLCMCLSEDAINTQLETAWASWKARKKWTDKISLFLIKKDKQGNEVVSKEGVVATVAPLKISLDVPDGKYGQVGVTITLEEGTVHYRGDDGMEEEPIENWSVSFLADLDKKPVDRDVLKRIDPGAYDEVKDLIDNAVSEGLDDGIFSIEYLFMKFTNVDMMVLDNRQISIPADVSDDAATVAKRAIGMMLSRELNNGFMLGTVVRRNDRTSKGTFALTDFVFHVHTHKTINTLDYLGMFMQRPLPDDLSTARATIRYPWVQAELLNGNEQMLNGAMIISWRSYFMDFLVPQVQEHLKCHGVESSREEIIFRFSSNWRRREEVALFSFDYINEMYWEVRLKIRPRTNIIDISGHITSRFNMEGGDDLTGYVRVKGSTNFRGTIEVLGDTPMNSARQPEPEKFSIRMKNEISFDKYPRMDEDESKGLISFTDTLESIWKALGLQDSTSFERIRRSQEDTINNIRWALDGGLERLNIQMNSHAFVPPGGGAFSYQNPHFSSQGDLYIDAIYHSA